jgi:site-specific recombinase XerD
LYNKWLSPLPASLSLKDISPFVLEKLKKQMKDANKAPRTITYALAVVGQVFNYARNNNLYSGDNPTANVKKPSKDNRRTRFLSHEDTNLLLKEFGETSPITRDMALLSLHCGLKAGVIFNLPWNDVNFSNETILIKDTKSGRNRNAIMTEEVKGMLKKENPRNIRVC